MKVKTSVSLSQELLEAIDRRCGSPGSRSAFIERAAWEVLRAEERLDEREREIELLNAIADGDFGEKPDTLDYGVSPDEFGDEFEDDDFVDPPR
jgi:Arc/MetJ-type ribon-helix-helix transcriptional regulator